MRITNEMITRMVTSNLSDTSNIIYDIQQKISSGRSITVPSDDPGMYEIIQRLKADQANNNQYERNLEYAQREMVSLENSLQNCRGILQRADELAIRGADATVSVSDRQSMGGEVDELLKNILSIANFSETGRYRYGGLKSDTKPYTTVDSDGDGMIDSVTYNGSTEVKQVEISRGVYIPASMPGSNLTGENAIFQTETVDLFNSLIDLRDRLLAGENLSETRTATADAATDTLASSASFATGSRVRITSTGTLPGGLSGNTEYFAIVTPGGIQLAASLNDARNGGPVIDITSAGTGTVSVESITGDTLTENINHVVNMLSTVGARQESCQMHSEILLAHQNNLITSLDEAESTDIAKAMVELSQQQLAYQSALRASSIFLNQPSLIDFI